LILNEAVTNAIKHAFTSQGGMVTVTLIQKENTIALSISDNGKGLPNNFNINTTHSQGMVMIQGLTRQLKGIFQISSSKGTHILITFPLLNSFEP
jgi:two-component sensor histidine kinase